MKKEIIVLTIILLVAFTLRLYRLGEVPVGFHRDEAFLGYNAFSLLQTARDISGNYLPLHLESYLFSPAGYSYMSIPFIFLFGLSEFSIRAASALLGTLTVVLLYVFIKDLLIKVAHRVYIALLSSALLAISPWHINLSRTATENITATFFIVLGAWLYLRWSTTTRLRFLILSFASFSVSLFTYQAPRAFLPLFLPFLILAFRRTTKHIVLPIVLFTLTILIPVVMILNQDTLSLRLKTVGLLATPESMLVLEEKLREDGMHNVVIPMARAYHNKATEYTSQYMRNYFAHFSYEFLFTDEGLPDRYRVPGNGLLYLVELPLILSGLLQLRHLAWRPRFMVLAWLIISFVGSALTYDDVPNLQRTVLVTPILAFICAMGIYPFLKISRLLLLTIILFYGYSITIYLHAYYVHQIVHRPWYRQEGYKALVNAVNELKHEYTRVEVTNRETAPSIFFLFYNRYDPQLLQRETQGYNTQKSDSMAFDIYSFTDEECPVRKQLVAQESGQPTVELTGETGVLYINSGLCTILPHVNLLKEIKRRDNTVVFQILDVGQ